MFVKEEMKRVAYTEEVIEDQLLEMYHPGEQNQNILIASSFNIGSGIKNLNKS